MTNLIVVPSSSTPQQVNKRYFSVHWKDEYIDDGDDLDHEEHNRIDTSSVDDDPDDDDVEKDLELQRKDDTNMVSKKKASMAYPKKKSSSASYPIRMSRRELQRLLQKQQDSIRRACQLELQLLNQSAAVRSKRMRLVQCMERLQRKLDGDDHNNNKFALPPVFHGKSSFSSRHGSKSTAATLGGGSSLTPMPHAKVIDLTFSSDDSTTSAAHSVE